MLGRCALDLDDLLDIAQLLRSRRGCVRLRVAGHGHESNHLRIFAVTIGETPSDVAIAAGNQRWRARQRDAHLIEACCGGIDEARPIPGVRHAQPQVHVVRDQRGAVSRAPTGDRPIVAARRLEPPGRRLGWFDGQSSERTQIDLGGSRDARRFAPAAVHRAIPLGRSGLDEAPQRLGERGTQQCALQLQMARRVLQLQEHRVCAQHGVLGGPGLGIDAEKPVLERPRVKRAQTGIRAIHVRIQHGPGRRIEARHGVACNVAKSMPPQLAIGREQSRTQKGREFAGRGAAQ